MSQLEEDLAEYRQQYNGEEADYKLLSVHILGMCQSYKQRNPNSIRVVFSRQPLVKEWASIVGKITRKRTEPGRANYQYGNLKDLIGMTVLCAFETDKRVFLDWLKKAFIVDEEDVIDNKETGHRGLHCIVKMQSSSCRANPEWIGKKCEIQIKTLLEEAFDAKSHDLAYKPGNRDVSDKVKAQFAQFSEVLRAVDKQSEFLKSLIMEEEVKFEIRRKACVSLYLSMVNDLITEMGVDPTKRDEIPEDIGELVSKIQRRAETNVDLPLCRYTALCALEYQDESLRRHTLVLCDSILKLPDLDSNAYLGVATVEWALGYFERAIVHVKKAIDFATRLNQVEDLFKAKSTFVYLVTDWRVMRRTSKAEWSDMAAKYKVDLEGRLTPDTKDTLGFYEAVFGRGREDVEKGRVMLLESYKLAPEGFKAFYEYHDYVALKRLMEMPYGRVSSPPDGALRAAS